MDKATAKLEVARMGLEYKWISTVPPSQGTRAAGLTTDKETEGALQITRHEKITSHPDRVGMGEGVDARKGATLTGSNAESISLQTGSLRGSGPKGRVESSSASVHQGSTLEMPVPTAVESRDSGVQAY